MTALLPMNEIQAMAEAVAKSGLFGVKTADQALSLMLIAQAEGRHPALAARDYDIIQGRPAKKTEAMLRDFLEQDGKVEWHKLDDVIADATFFHPSGGSVRITWDLKRANMAGLGGRDMWKKYPRQMLRSRTVSEGIRTVCPMATSGMYVPEEVRDIVREKDITPSAGVEEHLTNEQITKIKEIAAGMHAWLADGAIGDALYHMDNAALDADEKVYLWTHFDSKQRSAMKREQEAVKARKALPPPEVISDAAHKRLEARISEFKLDRESIKKYMKDTFGKDHFTELSKMEYDKLDAQIGAWYDTNQGAAGGRSQHPAPLSPPATPSGAPAKSRRQRVMEQFEGFTEAQVEETLGKSIEQATKADLETAWEKLSETAI